MTHRENLSELRARALELARVAYEGGGGSLREDGLPLILDLVGELGAVVLECERQRQILEHKA